MAMAWPGCMLHRTFSLSSVPVQFPVHGAAGHNRWGVVETPLPVKTQGRNMDRSFKFVAGCLLMARVHDEAGCRVPLAQCGRPSSLTQDLLTRGKGGFPVETDRTLLHEGEE